MKKLVLGTAVLLAMMGSVNAAEYVIDGTGGGMHSSVNFRASHLGISSLWGRFDGVTGHFSFDASNIAASKIMVDINPASINTNLEARDTHLKTGDYLDVEKFPTAGFVSTAVADMGAGKIQVTGTFTLHGVSKEISFVAVSTGAGDSPFGDYRAGFEGEIVINVADYGINLLPKPELSLWLAIEGIRQ